MVSRSPQRCRALAAIMRRTVQRGNGQASTSLGRHSGDQPTPTGREALHTHRVQHQRQRRNALCTLSAVQPKHYQVVYRRFRRASASQAHAVEPSNVDDGARKQMRDITTTRKASEEIKAHALDWPRLRMLTDMPRTASPSVDALPGGALISPPTPPREAAGSRLPFNSRGAEAKKGSWGHILKPIHWGL